MRFSTYTPRSYTVETPSRELRWNHSHLRVNPGSNEETPTIMKTHHEASPRRIMMRLHMGMGINLSCQKQFDLKREMCYDPVNLTVVEKDKDIFVRKIPFLQIWEKLLQQHEELELPWINTIPTRNRGSSKTAGSW